MALPCCDAQSMSFLHTLQRNNEKKTFQTLFFSISFQNTLESQQDKLDMMINNAADAEKSTHNEDQKVKVVRRNSHATVE